MVQMRPLSLYDMVIIIFSEKLPSLPWPNKPVDTLLTPLESETFTNKSICSICNCNGYPVNSPPQQTRHHKTRHHWKSPVAIWLFRFV